MPAPPVNHNLTYVCPEGHVFNHDWFATPFVLMTCQVGSMWAICNYVTFIQENGEFDAPDWESYQCVLPTTTECYDCTTTSKYIYKEYQNIAWKPFVPNNFLSQINHVYI